MVHPRLKQQLQRALESQQFKVHYQPKFHLSSGELQGVEALLRWRTDAGTWIAPSAFVPVLERTGMINDVSAWLLERAAADAMYWHLHGQNVKRVAVNISPLQLRDSHDRNMLLANCASWRAGGVKLDLELTESALMPSAGDVVGALDALAATNVRIALDDFGTGYSSLSLLARLPVRELKIDRSFVAQLGGSRKAALVVGAIIRLAREMGLQVIAEGIENERQLAHLRQLGCDIGQGFFFSAALNRDDLLARLQEVEALPRTAGSDIAPVWAYP